MDHHYFILRLIICFILSFLLGLEREIRKSSAGFRTNIIVCVGAFLLIGSLLLIYFQTNQSSFIGSPAL